MNNPTEAKISVVLICRNEKKHLLGVIMSLLNQSLKPYEIIVADGMSEDGSYEYLLELSVAHPELKPCKNHLTYAPHGLNIGIKQAKGDYIMIAGAHTLYNKEYLKQTVCFLSENPAAQAAGGVATAFSVQGNTLQKSFCAVYSSVFGVGGSLHRYAKEITSADTVAYAVYRREVFQKYGYFNESLIRNQDIEFNYRITKTGGKIYVLPIDNLYKVPEGFIKFVLKNFSNGYWNYITLKISKKGIGFRHFVPFLFVLYILLCIITGVFVPLKTSLIICAPLFLYTGMDILFSFIQARIAKEPLQFFFNLFIFPILHISYGTGTLVSIIRGGEK
ncbi:MAG TPA: glycosyltransferase family 2 protein [Petrotogaceae bacterium]|nr:glycosyltransferase family 2 protein [Petrotogaceae bacterium]